MSKMTREIECIKIHPTGKTDVDSERTNMQIKGNEAIEFHRMKGRGIVLTQASPGFGKTKMIVTLSHNNPVTFILTANNGLENQMVKDFHYINSGNNDQYISLGGNQTEENIISIISNNILTGKRSIIFCSNMCNWKGEYTQSTKKFINILCELYNTGTVNKCQVVIDEMDAQMTKLTGCATKGGGFDTCETNKLAYKKINDIKSVNIFNDLRKYNIFTVGFSGTLHSVTISRLPLLGYNLEEIGTICIYPIEGLYINHKLIHYKGLKPDLKTFDNLYHYMEQVEKSDGIIMLTFGDKRDIQTFKELYHSKTGNEISCIVFTSENHKRNLDLNQQCGTVKYILGIKMLCTGFNLSSYTSRKLELHIVFRPLSDKTTNAISNNTDHDLYSPQSPNMIQATCRQRDGGITIIPSYYENSVKQLYNILESVADAFVKGCQLWEGLSFIATTDTLRYAQCTLIGFKLNIERKECCDDVRNTIENDCKQMEKICGKNLIYIYYESLSNGSQFDDDYWACVIKQFLDSVCDLTDIHTSLYSVIVEKFPESVPEMDNTSVVTIIDDLVSETNESNISACTLVTHNLYEPNEPLTTPMPSYKPPPHKVNDTGENSRTISSGGMRKQRDFDTNAHIKLNSYTSCGLCITKFYSDDKTENAHVHEHHDGGSHVEDNLLKCCKGCHGHFDDHQIVLDPYGKVWYSKRIQLNASVSREQYRNISLTYIQLRWEAVKIQKKCSSDEEIYKILEERGYRLGSII